MRSWEVWNEPDYPSWWKGRPQRGEYLDLLKVVAAGIREADPTAEVVLGSLTNRNSVADTFLGQLYDLGAAPHFDTHRLQPVQPGHRHAGQRTCGASAPSPAEG